MSAAYDDVLQRIAAAEKEWRSAEAVRLIAVSKTFEAPAIEPLLAAGHRIFGENRVQEAKAKWPALRTAYPDIELHLIGPLQTNKLADALALFDVIHTLDRPKLAAKLAEARDRGASLPRLFVQVNTGGEPQKAGVFPDDLPAFLALCRDTYGLQPEGLMCIPPAEDVAAPHFAFLHGLAKENDLAQLSMGMSDDFEAAIAQGASYIRIGRALFGHRD